MTMCCHNCGRELEDGELLFADGCAYCINYYNPDKDNPNKKTPEETEGSLIGYLIGFALLGLLCYGFIKFFF